jgi:apolipoprotein N-acyltransferase
LHSVVPSEVDFDRDGEQDAHFVMLYTAGVRVGRFCLGCALAALSAALLTLSFAPYDDWWLIWVAFVPMVIAQHRVLPAAWAALGPAIGVGGFMAGYFGGVFPERAAWYMKVLPLIVGVLVFVTSRGERARRDRTGYAFWPLAAATGWVSIEMIRMFIPALGTWGFLGYALYRQAWWVQPVRVVGLLGLDLLIVLVNYALAMALIAGLDRRGAFGAPVAVVPQHAVRWVGGVLSALVGWCAFSLMLGDRGDPTLRVAVLQPGVRRADVGATPAERDRGMLERLTAQTREATSRGARLVVWPETALGADPATAYATELGELARTTGAYLVVGYGIHAPTGFRNEAVTVDPSGDFVGRYAKDHPVGFLGETSISRGTYPTIGTPFGTLATMICADTDFTDTGRKLALRGAKVIAVPSADWRAIAAKHYTLSVFRALETGAVVAKSEYSRDSAIIDGYGRIAASAVTPDGSQAILVADVPLRAGLPPAARFGDWVGWLCLVGAIGRRLWGSPWQKLRGSRWQKFARTSPVRSE